jgi:hypothetical protein
MRPAFSNLPAAVGPGQTYTGLVLTCSSVGSSTATGATCVPSASVGNVSNIVCVPATSPTAPDVASGSNIRCTFDYTGPPAQGGTDTGDIQVQFTGRTTATNDAIGGSDTSNCVADPTTQTGNNNCVVATTPIVDAIDDTPSVQQWAATGSTNYPLIGNDQLAGTTGPVIGTGGISAPTITGVTRGGTTVPNPFTVNPATGELVVPNNTAPGVYVVTYQICANGTTNACDTATKQVTIEGADMTSAIVCTPSGAVSPGTAVSCQLTCTNRGPNIANNAFCAFNAATLPAGVTVNCTPTSPQATLAVNATIVCSASSFPSPNSAISITAGTGADNDFNGGTTPTAGNNPSAAAIGGLTSIPTLGAFGLALLAFVLGMLGASRKRPS